MPGKDGTPWRWNATWAPAVPWRSAVTAPPWAAMHYGGMAGFGQRWMQDREWLSQPTQRPQRSPGCPTAGRRSQSASVSQAKHTSPTPEPQKRKPRLVTKHQQRSLSSALQALALGPHASSTIVQAPCPEARR